jgi:tryptophanyl-tRNA synthetase
MGKRSRKLDSETWFFVVDLHAMTMPYNPKILREKIGSSDVVFWHGIASSQINIFVQSHVPAMPN